MRPRSPIEPPFSCRLSIEPFSISPRRTRQKEWSRSSAYRCGFWNRSASVAAAWYWCKSTPRVRVMSNDFQIFGDPSKPAAKAALSSNAQGKQQTFHKALLASKHEVTKEEILGIAGEVGLDAQRLEAAIVNPELTKNLCWKKVPRTISLPIQPRSVVTGSAPPMPRTMIELQTLTETVTDATRI